jgi:hypothetical protein
MFWTLYQIESQLPGSYYGIAWGLSSTQSELQINHSLYSVEVFWTQYAYVSYRKQNAFKSVTYAYIIVHPISLRGLCLINYAQGNLH